MACVFDKVIFMSWKKMWKLLVGRLIDLHNFNVIWLTEIKQGFIGQLISFEWWSMESPLRKHSTEKHALSLLHNIVLIVEGIVIKLLQSLSSWSIFNFSSCKTLSTVFSVFKYISMKVFPFEMFCLLSIYFAFGFDNFLIVHSIFLMVSQLVSSY